MKASKSAVAMWLSVSYATFVATWCLMHHLAMVPEPGAAVSAARETVQAGGAAFYAVGGMLAAAVLCIGALLRA